MRITINVATFWAAGIFICGCASLATDRSTSELKITNISSTAFMQNILNQIGEKVPELGSISVNKGIPSSGQVWHGEEYAQAVFVLQKKVRYHPAQEFSKKTGPVPYADATVTITRYASSEDAQKDITVNLGMRPATPKPKQIYKGATLYRYASGANNVMCQNGLYIVEISSYSKDASSLTMKVLDVVLDELNSISSNPK